MDKITVKNLTVFAKHGVFSEERSLGQKFIISADLYLSTRLAGLTDDLQSSVHYGEVSDHIVDFLQQTQYQLIETMAENLAQNILLKFPLIEKITLEIKKPWAPVHLPLEDVSITITRRWHNAYIALGSNIGDRTAFLQAALDELAALPQVNLVKVSSFYETAPYGYTGQDPFLNACAQLRTTLTPHELLKTLQNIEQKHHRTREIHWGPRTLDLDILLYDDLILDTEDLIIPHPDMQNRSFVLRPLLEIAPALRHPLLLKTIRELQMHLEEV